MPCVLLRWHFRCSCSLLRVLVLVGLLVRLSASVARVGCGIFVAYLIYDTYAHTRARTPTRARAHAQTRARAHARRYMHVDIAVAAFFCVFGWVFLFMWVRP